MKKRIFYILFLIVAVVSCVLAMYDKITDIQASVIVFECIALIIATALASVDSTLDRTLGHTTGNWCETNPDSPEYIRRPPQLQISPHDVKIKRLNDNAVIPTQGSDKAAGFDLYACTDEYIKIPPHKTIKIPTGLSVELPDETFGAIYARSGLATKKGLAPANCVGVVDSDYRGEVIVALHNYSNFSAVVQPGDRIAQLVVQRYVPIRFVETTDLSETERAGGGFGSTGN